MTDREWVANEQFIQQFLHGNRSYSYWDGVVIKTELANIIETLGELGYTHQPEPPQDKVEAVKKILYPICLERGRTFAHKVNEIETITQEMVGNLAREILKLFPEPVARIKSKLIEARQKVAKKREKQLTDKSQDKQTTISLGGRLKGLQQAIDIVTQLDHDQKTIKEAK